MRAGSMLCRVFLIAVWFFPCALKAFTPYPVTPYPVCGYREISFFDRTSKSERMLLVWYPVDPQTEGTPSPNPWDDFKVAIDAPPMTSKTKRPVIAISHGYTGNPHQLSWLIRGLVHGGFIVLGIQHRDLIDGKVHLNLWQRPLDISTIIDQFSISSMRDAADLNKIGVAGYSLGGTTAIWIAGGRSTKLDTLIPGPEYSSGEDFTRVDEALPTLNRPMMAKSWREPRVKAAFIMAPAWAWLFAEENLQTISIPTYLIASSADTVLVTKNNAGYFAKNISKSVYQAIPGKADHYVFISALNEKERKSADPTDQLSFLFKDDPSVDRYWIQEEVAEEAIDFFHSVLDQTVR